MQKKSDLMFHLYLRGFVLGFSLKKIQWRRQRGCGWVVLRIKLFEKLAIDLLQIALYSI